MRRESRVVARTASDGAQDAERFGAFLAKPENRTKAQAEALRYLRNVLTVLGISDVEFVFAEALAMGPAAKEQAVAKASAQAEALPAVAATA